MIKESKQIIYVGIFVTILVISGILLIMIHSNNSQTALFNETDRIPSTIISQTIPAQNISLPIQGAYGAFSIEAKVPETPRFVPLYKGTLSDDDLKRQVKFAGPNLFQGKNNTPSKAEAPALAEKALKSYGGLPKDAVLANIFISEEITEKSSGEITKRVPTDTSVSYTRQINGMPVTGDADHISVALGENGELLELRKRWRTLEKTGDIVQVITPDIAVEKLMRGETLNKLQSLKVAHIDDVRLGYYEPKGNMREIILEPVWIFKSTSSQGFELQVAARVPEPALIPANITTTTTTIKMIETSPESTITINETVSLTPSVSLTSNAINTAKEINQTAVPTLTFPTTSIETNTTMGLNVTNGS